MFSGFEAGEPDQLSEVTCPNEGVTEASFQYFLQISDELERSQEPGGRRPEI